MYAFIPNSIDPYVYMNHKDGQLLFMTIHVDYWLVCFISIQKIDEVLKYMDQFFENKQGVVFYYVGLHSTHDHAHRQLVLDQEQYSLHVSS